MPSVPAAASKPPGLSGWLPGWLPGSILCFPRAIANVKIVDRDSGNLVNRLPGWLPGWPPGWPPGQAAGLSGCKADES